MIFICVGMGLVHWYANEPATDVAQK